MKIEKNIPIPEITGGRNLIYPFDKMETGDSFSGGKGAVAAAYSYGERHGMKFSVRKDGDSYRIWRIS